MHLAVKAADLQVQFKDTISKTGLGLWNVWADQLWIWNCGCGGSVLTPATTMKFELNS